jgi:hypothetical protein
LTILIVGHVIKGSEVRRANSYIFLANPPNTRRSKAGSSIFFYQVHDFTANRAIQAAQRLGVL